MTLEEKCVVLVDTVCSRYFSGKIPPDTVAFVGTLLTAFVPDNVDQRVKELFAYDLVQAIDCLRRQREARWQN